MKKLTYISLFLLLFTNSYSQVIDTVFVGETTTYKVQNQQEASYLYWEVTSGEIISENPSLTDSIVILWDVSGVCELIVYEETESNCVGELATVEIEVIETDYEIELNIPNTFTPNNDNKNDHFTIKANYPPQNYSITIVNRLGKKVFEANDINYSWDGRIKGRDCSPGVYYYVIQYQSNGTVETKNGFLNVFR